MNNAEARDYYWGVVQGLAARCLRASNPDREFFRVLMPDRFTYEHGMLVLSFSPHASRFASGLDGLAGADCEDGTMFTKPDDWQEVVESIGILGMHADVMQAVVELKEAGPEN